MESWAVLATCRRLAPPASPPKPGPRPPPPPPPPRRRLRFPRRRGSLLVSLAASLGGQAVPQEEDECVERRDEGFIAFDSRDREEGSKGWIHFVGIGGSGLSALAMLALKQGYEVSGSDIMWGSLIDKMRKAGARIHIGHSKSNIEKNSGSSLPNAVVISSAIPPNNEEVAYAKSVGIQIHKRDVWLGKLTEQYNLIAVSGTHGKSTTAAMLSYVLEAMGDNPIAVVGAHVPQFSAGSIILGSGPNFVLEADEYDGCFLGLSPYVAVVTSVEWDHVDHFGDEEAVRNIFRRFLHRIRVDGHLILCGDSVGAYALLSDSREETVSNGKLVPNSLVSSCGYNVITYGTSSENEWHASSITPNSQGGQDYVLYHRKYPITNISLSLPGVHNVLNSLAVIATVITLVNDRKPMHDTINCVRYHLSTFQGVSRRFELIGKVPGCHIYDDYAHHPTAVRAVLQAARLKYPSHALWVVFQPHTFSRLAALMKDFAMAFLDADYVVVTQIYAARESNDWNSNGRDLATLITRPSSVYIPRLEDAIDTLVLELSSCKNQETIVITLGAGDITNLGPRLLRRLQQIS